MRRCFEFVLGLMLLGLLPPSAKGDALDRMDIERLRATHEKVESLKRELRKVTLPSGYDDVRALLHVHSGFSHDSRGSLEEIVSAANKLNVRVILFTEHPNKFSDYVNDGHHGVEDGVLLIPGAELTGFLAYPKTSVQKQDPKGPQEVADLVRGTDGLIFLCHLEERMKWEINGLTGSEIYNTHADVKDERRFLAFRSTPAGLLALQAAVKLYPQEVFAALQDYPTDYLKRWDQLCQKAPHTGVSANDAHHNNGVHGDLTAEGKIQLVGALGDKLTLLDPEKVPLLKPLLADKKPGERVFDLELDPYERSFRHVSTHLLMHDVTEQNVWDTLKAGRAYVAFDWMADPTGFVLRADRGNDTWPMGSEVPGAQDLRLRAEAPLAGTFKLVRDGEVISEQAGNAIDVPVDKPGNYRVEVWLTFAGEPRPWILSNPIYVRAK